MSQRSYHRAEQQLHISHAGLTLEVSGDQRTVAPQARTHLGVRLV